MSLYRVVVTPLSDTVLPPLLWSGPFTSKAKAQANVTFWRAIGSCSTRIETVAS